VHLCAAYHRRLTAKAFGLSTAESHLITTQQCALDALDAMDQLDQLASWLRVNYVHDLLVPCIAERKVPAVPHKDNQWSWGQYDRYRSAHPQHGNWALLLHSICVVDADCPIWACDQERARQELQSCPKVETTKGNHFFFLRPAFADEDGYFDGARQRSGINVDFKSICSTGTSGLIVVAPAPGKTWVPGRELWSAELSEIPRDLLESIATPKLLLRNRPTTTERGRATTTAVAVLAELPAPTGQLSHGLDGLDRLLACISKTRWDDRNSWRDIATALRNEYPDDAGEGSDIYSMWIRHSRSSRKFVQADADKLWRTVATADGYTGRRVTLGTVCMWARHDDPVAYGAYRSTRVSPHVLEMVRTGDRGLAILAAETMRDVVKRVGGGTFYIFDDTLQVWKKCEDTKDLWIPVSEAVEELLADLDIATMYKARAATSDKQREAFEAEREVVQRALCMCRSHSGMRHMVEIAASLFHDGGFENKLDSVRHLLGVRNGVVDLRTGVLRARKAEDMLYTLLDVDYDSEADDSDLRDTVRSAMADDEEMACFLQTLLGYAVTGEVSAELFVVFTGGGRNGKGIITQLLDKLLGAFYAELNPGIIVDRVVSNIDAERGKLLGARVAVFNELRAGEKLKTNEVQLLSGGDGIPARPLYHAPMTIYPRHLCVLCTNHMPELSEVIPAIAERLLCVHFPVTFTDLVEGEAPSLYRRQADRALKGRLMGNLPGALKWLVDGAVRWYAAPNLRRDAPAKVKEFSRVYLEEQDRLAAFLRDHCDIADDHRVSSVSFLDAYKDANDDIKCDSKQLVAAMKVKGFLKKAMKIRGSNVQGFAGVQLRKVEMVADSD
jgi:P4 family phage/plasmid primase-like protien